MVRGTYNCFQSISNHWKLFYLKRCLTRVIAAKNNEHTHRWGKRKGRYIKGMEKEIQTTSTSKEKDNNKLLIEFIELGQMLEEILENIYKQLEKLYNK